MAQLRWRLLAVLVTLFVVLAPLQASADIIPNERCWVGKPQYAIGETIRIFVQLTTAATHWLVIIKPDGTSTQIGLPSGPGTFSVAAIAGPPPGQRIVQLFMQVGPVTKLSATCYFSVTGGRCTLTVIVVDAKTRRPVPFARVYLDDIFVGSTNIKGTLVIRQLSLGVHRIYVAKEGYVGLNASIRISGNNTIKTVYLKRAWPQA